MKRCGMLLVPMVLIVSTVQAGELHRCVGPAGNVSYQTAVCPDGHRTYRTIAFVRDPGLQPAVNARQHVRPLRPSKPNASKRDSARVPRVDPCAHAKAKREQAISRLGLKRTYDQLSKIDAAVRAVCDGY